MSNSAQIQTLNVRRSEAENQHGQHSLTSQYQLTPDIASLWFNVDCAWL
jgi:hypothetical protein